MVTAKGLDRQFSLDFYPPSLQVVTERPCRKCPCCSSRGLESRSKCAQSVFEATQMTGMAKAVQKAELTDPVLDSPFAAENRARAQEMRFAGLHINCRCLSKLAYLLQTGQPWLVNGRNRGCRKQLRNRTEREAEGQDVEVESVGERSWWRVEVGSQEMELLNSVDCIAGSGWGHSFQWRWAGMREALLSILAGDIS